MALLEINLEKPALVEEYQFPSETPAGEAVARKRATDRSESSRGQSSGGGKGKLVGLLAALAGVGVLAWKLKQLGGDGESVQSQEYEHGPEPDIGSDEGGVTKKVAGLVGFAVALVGLALAVQKRRK